MKCPRCNQETNTIYCVNCNTNIVVYKKIINTSRLLYNEALCKAKSNDLTGAIKLLLKSTKYNKKNIEARNLLGLLYYRIGEIGEALKQWIISSNYCGDKNNRANYYINQIQKNQKKMDQMNATIRMYNEALDHLKNKSEDYAKIKLKKAIHINSKFIKAQNLLALCYIKNHNYKNALKIIKNILSIDCYNEYTLKLKREIEVFCEDKTDDMDETIIPSRDQNINKIFKYSKKERNMFAPFMQILLFILGVACGVAVIFTLYMPDKYDEYTQKITNLENEIKTYKNTILVKEDEIEQLKSNNQESTNAINELKEKENYYSNQNDGHNALYSAILYYIEDDYSNSGNSLLDIDIQRLSSKGLLVYRIIKEKISPTIKKNFYNQGINLYTNAKNKSEQDRINDYNEAIQYFEKSIIFCEEDELLTTENLYFIARSYQNIEDNENAKNYYDKFFETYTGNKSNKRYRDAQYFYNLL